MRPSHYETASVRNHTLTLAERKYRSTRTLAGRKYLSLRQERLDKREYPCAGQGFVKGFRRRFITDIKSVDIDDLNAGLEGILLPAIIGIEGG